MPISVRKRFEVFKRDNFTCRYCGRKPPEIVLEPDHIVPRAAGGSDDEMNLVTSCWDCNRGKSDKLLAQIVTGEDPHDRAVMLLERERELREHNEVLARVRKRVDASLDSLCDFWRDEAGKTVYGSNLSWLRNALERYPEEMIRRAMTVAIHARKTDGFAHTIACLKNLAERVS